MITKIVVVTVVATTVVAGKVGIGNFVETIHVQLSYKTCNVSMLEISS